MLRSLSHIRGNSLTRIHPRSTRLFTTSAATPQTPNWKIHRTGITALLWGQRQLEIQKQRLNETKGLIVPHVLTPKKPSDSIVEISLPFGSNSELRDQYLSPFGHIRIGRLLEDLDAMAGNIAFLHADDGNPGSAPLVIVTASLDRIHLHRPLMPDQDLVLRGQVTWVGRSSMEIEISANSTHDNAPSIVAVFTMVATDPMTKKSTQVNPLEPVTEEEKKRFDLGEKNRQSRLERKQNSLANEPPTVDERLVLHRVFMEWNKKVDNADYVTMSSTTRQSVILCQPSERNFANKIFGGYLMRSGFELAFSTAYLFCKTRPSFEAMDDTTFHRPVEIGSILCLKAQVVYSKEGHVMVQVRAHVTDPKIGKEELTNVFNFTFKCEQPEQGAGALRRVYPESYAEAMAFLEGRRLFHQHQTSCQ